MIKLKKLIALMIFVIHAPFAYSTHISGGDLTYKALGGNQYEITLVLYRDCAGIPVQNPEPITATSAQGTSFTFQVSLIPGTGNEITFPCFGANTVCSGGVLPGFQRYEYKGTVTLPPNSNWNLSWTDCCRNCAITTTQGGCSNSFLIEANLNNLSAPGDNSPVFTNFPVAFLCIAQNFTYNHGVLDTEGDSLVYTFISPRVSSGTPISFNPGYSATNFLTSSTPITLNTNTGDINITPALFEVGITAIRIDSYRNGIWIGNVMRDIQFQVQNCSPNVLPTATGINGTNSFDTLVCAGTPLCFDIFTNDQNIDQILTVTWNEGIPGGTFTTTSDPFPVATFCWTPTQADARTQPYSFTILVKDDNCSFNSFQVYSYQIFVPFVPVDSAVTVPLCDETEKGAIYLTQNAVGQPFTYLWYDGDVSPQKTDLSPGTYTVTVTNVIGCVATKEIVITPAPEKLNAVVVLADSSTTPFTADGSLQAVATGGTPPYTYLWSSGGTGSLESGLLPGTYTVTVTDVNDCEATAQGVVVPKCPVATCSGTSISCPGLNNATATVSVSGDTTGLSIVWNGNPQLKTSTIRNLSPGTYTAVITNANGCSDTCSVVIPSTPCDGFATYTMGGYGAVPMAGNPAMYVKNNFNSVFPSGITIGCNNTLKLTNHQAVLKFLPSSGTPSLLPPGQLINPIGYKNTFAGQLVTAILNAGFDSANFAFAPSQTTLGNLVIVSGILRGKTVNEAIEIANRHIGGCDFVYTPSQLTTVLRNINENYLEGTANGCFLSCPVNGNNARPYSGDFNQIQKPEWNVYPNPAGDAFKLVYESIESGQIKVDVISITTGQSTVIYTGNMKAGDVFNIPVDTRNWASGVYMIRMSSDLFTDVKRLIISH
jgi:hypothetical protein